MANITIYTSSLCPYCFRAKALLEEKGANYNEISVDMKPDVRAEMRKKADGATSVPQIWIGSEHVGGCDDLYSLEQKGALDILLEDAS